MHAYTTAAVINFGMCAPEEAVTESAFMPNFRHVPRPKEPEGPPIPEAELSAYQANRAHLAALLEIYTNTGVADPYLVKIGLVRSNG